MIVTKQATVYLSQRHAGQIVEHSARIRAEGHYFIGRRW